ncbi:RICIN domain-containing protein [Streptomyces uncialis]|uniref:RICIN domain-containing protein n=1 Tax=Streptomyces uncialis TaxID=1048205 RepID=UPI002F90E0BB|nr:RICIN domain-containing protein [Streptomyces uncialis]
MRSRTIRHTKALTAAVFLFGSVSASTAVAAENTPSRSQTLTFLVNNNSGKVLEVYGGGTANGAGVVQWEYNGANWQYWNVTFGGTLTLITNHNSGKCLEVHGGGTANGAGVVQWDCNGQNWQKWRVTPNGDGTYRITNHNSGKCLEVHGGGTANGAGVVQWDCNGANWQKWW